MKLYSKLILGIAALLFISSSFLVADTITTTYPYPNNTPVPLNYAPPSSSATSSSNAVIAALNAQALLLKDLTQEHEKRAADLTQKNQPEKAKWETDLVNELQEKLARVQKSINSATEAAPGASVLKAAAGDADDHLIFVSTIESRLEQVRQDISAAIADTHGLSLQIATNKAPEAIATISSLLSDNQRMVKELQREQLDLELRKLEFRALLKAMQK